MIKQQQSHVQGASEPPIIEVTVGAMLSRAAVEWPQEEALVSVEQGLRWSYAEFNRQVDLLAAGLQPVLECPVAEVIALIGIDIGDQRRNVWASVIFSGAPRRRGHHLRVEVL